MPRRFLRTVGLSFAILASVTSGIVRAQQESTSEESAHQPSHGHHKNVIGFFVGEAYEDGGSRDNGLALGLEYERRLSARFGIGALVEHTYGDLAVLVYAVSFAYHKGPWKLYAAPGIEETDSGNERMLRLGIEYGFSVGEWEISPQFDVDLVDREAEVFVFGVTFARGFNF